MTIIDQTQAGVYDIPEDIYRADPVDGGSLTASDCKLLIDSPAKYRHRQLSGEEHRDTFDFGHAAHSLVLGAGRGVVVIDADDWRTKDAKDAKAQAHVEGKTPILAKDWATVEAMAAAIRDHPLASALLDPTRGTPEQTLIWQQAGTWRRCRLDWLPDRPRTGRMIVPDYKTTPNASTRKFANSAADYGYHQQAAWYLDGIRAVFGVDDPAFVFIAQEKVAPYLVNVIELDSYALDIGRTLNAEAVEIWNDCRRTGEWPGYPPEVQQVALPRWAQIEFEENHQ